MIYIERQSFACEERKLPVQSLQRESDRQVEVNGLIARTRHEWGLFFMAGLIVYGGAIAWASKWFGPTPAMFYFVGVLAVCTAAALTASIFRGTHYYNKRYDEIWERYS